jgi:predicted DNA-binding transcriptional regulator AlpA
VTADPTALLLADTEAAALAGVSRATWHRLRAAGKLPPPVKLGRCVRWSRAELVTWIDAGCPPAPMWSELQAQARRRASK